MRVLSKNKKGRFNYTLNEFYQCGIVLTGTEVRMVLKNGFNFNETYCYIKDGEIWVKNFHINEMSRAVVKQDPKRDKKLLLKKSEIKKISDKLKDKSNVIIPTTLLVNENYKIKIEIGVGSGNKEYDKRNNIKEKEIKRELDRVKKTKGEL